MWVLSLGLGLLPRRLILGLGTWEPGKSVGLGDGREGAKSFDTWKKGIWSFLGFVKFTTFFKKA
jgi:hypothetical protein